MGRLYGERGIELTQIGTKLLRTKVMDALQPKTAGRFDIFEDIVNKNSLAGISLHRFEGRLKDQRRGLAGADRAGIDTC